MRLDPGWTADDLRAALERAAAEAYGAERARDLAETLRRTAEALARIAATPLAPWDEPPDASGVEEEQP